MDASFLFCQTQQKLHEQVLQQLQEQLQMNILQQTQLIQQGPNKVLLSSLIKEDCSI